jgi:hypothetical protein
VSGGHGGLPTVLLSRDRNDDGGSIAIPASYLETILTLR